MADVGIGHYGTLLYRIRGASRKFNPSRSDTAISAAASFATKSQLHFFIPSFIPSLQQSYSYSTVV